MVTPMRNPDFVYKIAARPAAEAAAAEGKFPRMPIDDKDGYIHFSTAEQLAETLRLHFAGQGNLVLLAVRPIEMGAGLRWEPSRGGQLFPHLYADLHIGALGQYATISVADDGSVTLPEWVQ